LRRRVIRSWLVRQGAPEVTYGHVLAVEELVTGWHGQSGVDVPGLFVRRLEGRLVCAP
jgi:tRNA(Ile)-lysidine synthase